MVKYTSQKQIKLELFKHPFNNELDPNNRWVKLSKVIPWDDLANIYSQKLDSNRGRFSVDVRTVLAALIIKHFLKLDDRGTIQMIQENIYLQFFCGLPEFTHKPVFDPSLFVDIRKRLGGREFDEFNKLVISKFEAVKSQAINNKKTRKKKKQSIEDKDKDKDNDSENQNQNKGTLIADATIADQEIKFPNDVDLLNQAREHLERMVDTIYQKNIDKQKPRLYRRVARREFLNFTKKKRKSKKFIRQQIKKQLQYVRRNLKVLQKMLSNPQRQKQLRASDIKLLTIINQLYQQQKQMYEQKIHSIDHRIVSLYQYWVRPMVRGKSGKKVEFGAKINIMQKDGFVRVNHFDFEAFNEGQFVEAMVESYYEFNGYYPEYFLADKLYLNRANRKYLKEKNIKIVNKPLGRPPKQNKETTSEKRKKRKKAAERNQIEGKFGQAKRGFGLNNIKARLAQTSESWVNAILFVLNLKNLVEQMEKYGGIFLSLFKKLYNCIKNWFKFEINRKAIKILPV